MNSRLQLRQSNKSLLWKHCVKLPLLLGRVLPLRWGWKMTALPPVKNGCGGKSLWLTGMIPLLLETLTVNCATNCLLWASHLRRSSTTVLPAGRPALWCYFTHAATSICIESLSQKLVFSFINNFEKLAENQKTKNKNNSLDVLDHPST